MVRIHDSNGLDGAGRGIGPLLVRRENPPASDKSETDTPLWTSAAWQDIESTVTAGERLAGLAQLVEHLICNQGVGGSSPSAGTNKFMSSPDTWVTERT
jgi:hypothetical protein